MILQAEELELITAHTADLVGWNKFYINGTVTRGSDSQINAGASWSQSNQTDIYRVDLLDIYSEPDPKLLYATIVGSTVGDFWQSDQFEVGVLDSDITRVKRRIMRQIQADEDYLINQSNQICMVTFFSSNKGDPNNIGKWLVIEIDCVLQEFTVYLSDTIL